jgi:hypothetical protein
MADDETTDPQQTDFDEDPREQGTGQGGYPESNPEGTQDDDAATGRSKGPGSDESRGGGSDRAPSVANEKEGDRAASTGNPDAAG